ncbi:hypothetical protein [Streptomyces sp. NPDC001250]
MWRDHDDHRSRRHRATRLPPPAPTQLREAVGALLDDYTEDEIFGYGVG